MRAAGGGRGRRLPLDSRRLGARLTLVTGYKEPPMRNDSSIRPHLYTVRLSPEEDARAHRIAEHLGMPISTLFRMLLLKEERALGLDAPKPKRRSA